MLVQGNFYKFTISEIFYQIWHSGQITYHHRWGLMSALMQDSLNQEEREAIDRLLHAVRRGWLRLVD
ncbi:MAG TPA: hypothetical protein IGS52_04250 [Oscillatoriaceae cyanobacterium M33_DOE_052]|uniref:Uncharacterized protein n=1 Tax=Planktothricoides sp. SpSt-374 TaxID=2282167 RepID=A0A7C3ZHP2_9CYAN|nr:hypothetical protein [[Phormidium] sp. ETS-05]HIK09467.1 hypothetical protein [Oscillatoriaceae cyanobacterium M33_DOE_052]